MSMDLTGINNINEYYTNHYLATVFAENIKDIISAWREQSRETGEAAPWARLRDVGRRYYVLKERYNREKRPLERQRLLMELSAMLLEELGYKPATPTIKAQVREGVIIPLLAEVNKPNGAPLLWAMLSRELDNEQNLLQGGVLYSSWRKEDDEWLGEPEKDLEKAAGDISGMDYETLLSKIVFSQDEPPRWVLLFGMDQVAMIDRNKWNEKRLIEFDLDEIFGRREETTLQAMAVLLHKDNVCPADGGSLLDTLSDNSHKHASGVSEDLKYALRECIELLGNEAVYDMKQRQHAAVYDKDLADQLTRECLRYMYRILFLLFIEARPELGYAPVKSQEYLKGYSLESLREIIDDMRDDSDEVNKGTYLHQTLNKLFSLIYNGYPESGNSQVEGQLGIEYGPLHGAFTIPTLKAHIFDLQFTPLLNRVMLRNKTLLRVIDLMSISRPRRGRQRRGRISYASLGINQLGAVYEALLSYRGFFAEEKLYEVKRAGINPDELEVGYFVNEEQLSEYDEDERVREADGKLKTYEKGTFIYRLAGRERQKSASYYTPEPLTRCLVKYALKELLKDKTADEILDLTICEPAMGSAAFLNEAVSQLADAYLQLKQKETGESIPHDRYTEERQRVKMYIADRNVYGIDLNPVAVELAEVSLWLNTIYAGSFVPWFGTQLKCGNSLIGARRQVYTVEQVTAEKEPKIWYANAPERVMPGKRRDEKEQVYHFLLGDPGMADYNDKVIKELAGEQLKKIKKWRKSFITPLDRGEAETLLRLSNVIDSLWERHTAMRRQVDEMTTDDLPVFGKPVQAMHKPSTTREKDNIYKRMYLTEGMQNAGPYARLKFAMDYWCSLWFWPIEKADLLPIRQEYLLDMSLIIEGGVMNVRSDGQPVLFADDTVQLAIDLFNDIPEVNLDMLCEKIPRLKMVRELTDRYKFLHWELEFADMFAERGGFDLVVGNPPWIKVEWNEQAVLSDKEPKLAVKDYSAAETVMMRNDVLTNVSAKALYFNEYEELTAFQKFYCAAQNYPELIGVQTNLYKIFLPQAWMFNNKLGVSAFVHPEGVYYDSKGGRLRSCLYRRLRMHFQFQNERKLFPIGNRERFSLNIYSNKITNEFVTISNLFDVVTIDECYSSSISGPVPGIKDQNNKWCIKGHPSRMVTIGNNELAILARLFDSTENPDETRLPILHAQQLLDVFSCFFNQKTTLASMKDEIYHTEMWHETNSQNDGTICRGTRFPEEIGEFIYSGPHIGVANPMYKTPRRVCNTHKAYDEIDLMSIPINSFYLQRTNYTPAIDRIKYFQRVPNLPWGGKYTDYYRIIMRRRLNQSGERTLISTITPPGTAHVNTVLGLAYKDNLKLALTAAIMASIPFDYLIKVIGKEDVYFDTLTILPIPISSCNDALILRALLLNCLTKYYSELWENCWHEKFIRDVWSKNDERLPEIFSRLTRKWTPSATLRTDYARRQALIEIDVLTAMSLGMTLQQLQTIYRVQFPVLQANEANTWYDQNGRIVFTVNVSFVNTGFNRAEWEKIKDAKSGTINRTITDDTMPGGPVERTIEYVAPFDRCDREQDYETAWRHFEQRFGQAREGGKR